GVAGDQFKIANMLRPVLISFNACTPLFNGRMTKFSSARTHYYKLTYEEHGLSKNGCLLDMDSVTDIDDFRMIATHAFNDIIARMKAKGIRNYEPYFDALNTIWGGVREGKYGTVESRISDANPLLENLFASLALHRGLDNLLFSEDKAYKVEIHTEKCIYSQENKLMIPSFSVLQHLEELSLLSLYPRGGYNGIHPELLALCASAVKFAEMGLPWEQRRFLKPYKKMVLGEEEALFIKIWKYAEEKKLLRERDLSFTPDNAGRLRNFIYYDIFLPSLRQAQEEFSIEPDIIV
ncbi:MAG: hypothetical protein FJ088_10395, partial [Deltaproteobacteria bacterium]|nr:hypothetical protein [Deltaproteobacteria bacterium]